MTEKTRYSDAELEEFRTIIMEKLELAQRDYDLLRSSLNGQDANDTDDTSPTYKVLEEGANTLSKEETTPGTTPIEVYPSDYKRLWCALKQNVLHLPHR